MKTIDVVSCPRFAVNQSVGGDASPLPVPGILICLELYPEERNLITLASLLTSLREAVSFDMFRCRIVENDDVSALRVEEAIIQEHEEEHAT